MTFFIASLSHNYAWNGKIIVMHILRLNSWRLAVLHTSPFPLLL